MAGLHAPGAHAKSPVPAHNQPHPGAVHKLGIPKVKADGPDVDFSHNAVGLSANQFRCRMIQFLWQLNIQTSSRGFKNRFHA